MNSELSEQIENVINLIEQLAPEAKIIESSNIYDGEDANLFVYPPLSWTEERCLELQDNLASQLVDVLIDHGYLILATVYLPEQQIQLAQYQMRSALKSASSAKKTLSTARELGLLSSEPSLSELTLA